MPWIGSTTNAATSPRSSSRASALEVAERDRVAAGQQRAEALAEDRLAVERQRAERQAVEGVLGVEDPRAPGRRARDLDRRLDRLRAAVRRHHRADARRRAREQLLGEHAAEQRHAELRQVAGPRGHRLLHGRDRLGVVAPDREHAIAAEQVEVALAALVDQVRALAAAPRLVEAERPQDPAHLRVQEAVVQLHLLAGAAGDDLSDGRRRRAVHALSVREARRGARAARSAPTAADATFQRDSILWIFRGRTSAPVRVR